MISEFASYDSEICNMIKFENKPKSHGLKNTMIHNVLSGNVLNIIQVFQISLMNEYFINLI